MSTRVSQKKTQINRQELLNLLTKLQPGLSPRDVSPEKVCFIFLKDRIVTDNEFVAVSVPMQTGIQGAVKAEEFYQLLDKIPGEFISLDIITKPQTKPGEPVSRELRITTGKIKAGISMLESTINPPEPEGEPYPLPQGFKEAIRFTMFSTSRDMTRPELTCLHFQGKSVSSSDNWRITQLVMEHPMPFDILLPAEAAIHLLKLDPTHIVMDSGEGGKIHFLEEPTGVVFSVARRAAPFLSVDRYFEIDGDPLTFPDTLMEALGRSRIMIEAKSDLDLKIKLSLTSGMLSCRGEKEIGWIEEDMEIDYQGEEAVMAVNPIFLEDILSRTQNIILGKRACLFQGEGFQHVMMLLGT